MKLIISLIVVAFSQLTFAQTYVVTDPQGNVSYYVQKQGNQAQIVNNQGQVVQNATIYPNQVVTPQSYAIGTPSYTVPMSPPSPPSPRVLQ
jgi:formylmethanofuran dehydrogenase subunit D